MIEMEEDTKKELKEYYINKYNAVKISVTAIEKSLVVWAQPNGNMNGIHGCPLCNLYYLDGCEGCPIFHYTNLIHCDGTPYSIYNWEQYFDRYLSNEETKEKEIIRQKQYEFLKVVEKWERKKLEYYGVMKREYGG